MDWSITHCLGHFDLICLDPYRFGQVIFINSLDLRIEQIGQALRQMLSSSSSGLLLHCLIIFHN